MNADKSKERIETLLTALDETLQLLNEATLYELDYEQNQDIRAKMRQIKGYVQAVKAEIEREGEL